mmetsp:Transcript_34753/g.90135  ORF Transcript_34753/g.90135 Transcript_34753/m.90135 type:complete len:715 (+) Transcript_34753:138-2282(+)
MFRRKTEVDPSSTDRHAKLFGADFLSKLKGAKSSSRSKSALEAEVQQLRTIYVHSEDGREQAEKKLTRALARADELEMERDAWRLKYTAENKRRTDLEGEVRKLQYQLKQALEEKDKLAANARPSKVRIPSTPPPSMRVSLEPIGGSDSEGDREGRMESAVRTGLRDALHSSSLSDVLESEDGKEEGKNGNSENDEDDNGKKGGNRLSEPIDVGRQGGEDSDVVLKTEKVELLHKRSIAEKRQMRAMSTRVTFSDGSGHALASPLQKVARRITQIGTFTKARRQSTILSRGDLKPNVSPEKPLSSRMPTERFFEHFVIVGVPSTLKIEEDHLSVPPSVLVHFPAEKKLDHPELPMFVFPGEVPLKRLPRRNSDSRVKEIVFSASREVRDENCHMFVLNGDEILYGLCFLEEEVIMTPDGGARVAPKGYCFISKFPFSEVHLRVLMTILSRLRFSRLKGVKMSQNSGGDTPVAAPKSPLKRGRSAGKLVSEDSSVVLSTAASGFTGGMYADATHLEYDESLKKKDSFAEQDFMEALRVILSSYYSMHIPLPGVSMSLPCLPGSPYMDTSKVFRRPSPGIPEVVPLLGRWGLPAALRVLPFEAIELILAASLLERNIIFKSKNLGLLSSISLVIPPLLHPLSWQSAYIPVLPSTLIDFIQSPVPFIVGVMDLPLGIEPSPGTLLVDLDANEIFYNSAKVVKGKWPKGIPLLPSRRL